MTSLDPTKWEMLYVTTRRDPADMRQMNVVIQGSLPDIEPDDWPIITILRGYQPMRYAQAVITAAVQARHESLIWDQMVDRLGLDERTVVAPTIAEMRQLRPPNPYSGPLTFAPIYGLESRRGLVDVAYEGTAFCQWEVDDALTHAHGVLEAAATAPLDAMYFRYLTETLLLDPIRASAAVHDLGAAARAT